MGRFHTIFIIFFFSFFSAREVRWDEGSVLNTTCASCLYDNSILTTAAVWSTLPLCGSLSVWFHLTSGHVEVFVGNWYDIWDRKWISSPWPGKRMRATVTSLEPFWKVEIFSTRSVQSERTNKVLGKQKMLGAAPSLLAAACRGRRSLLFGNNWKKLGVEVLLLEQVMMFKHVWTTLYFLSLTVKVNNYLMSDWKSQIYSLGCPKVPSGCGPFR